MTSEALQHEDELLSRPWIWVEDPQWEMADNLTPAFGGGPSPKFRKSTNNQVTPPKKKSN